MTKKIFVLLLSLLIVFCGSLPAFAVNISAELLTVYSDGMLFQQLKSAIIEGCASPGKKIKAELYNDNNELVSLAETTAQTDGSFMLEFTAPKGSYNEYTIVFYENNTVFRTLKNIVFGELWLASGQSNMQYPLAQSVSGREMYADNKKLSKWLRVLMVPAYPEYKGSTELIPGTPQNDITDSVWVNGENEYIYSMSAVAYFFAEKLMKELDMPVGILNSSLGGSTLISWLSRDAIESNAEIKSYLEAEGTYISESDWNEAEQNVYQDMTANYNQKIAPLSNFRPSGMIWYQGESDLMLGNTQYDKQFSLLQESYTEEFGYENGLFPIIYTQIASFYYSDDGLALSDWNIDYTEIQEDESDSRAVISINDIPLTYLPEAGLIHPEHKEEIGERMAFSALGLVYKEFDSYTASTIADYTIENGSVYINLKNIGDGIICSEDSIKGFAVCGEDRQYVNANAEIIDSDTVRVWSEYINDPYAVTYAYGVSNQTANLYASLSGEPALPVSVFRTDEEATDEWFDKPWTFCDSDKVWFTEDDSHSGFYDTWTADNAEITVDKSNCLVSGNGLGVTAESKKFSVSPTFGYKSGITNKTFRDTQTDYTSYGTISFSIRNNGTEDIVFEGMRFYKNAVLWYTPAVADSLDNKTVIPADGKTYTVTLDLNRVYHLDNQCSLSYSSSKLKNITKIELRFSSDSSNSDISIDAFSFGPAATDKKTGYEIDLSTADNIIEIFTGIFLEIFAKVVSLFKK